MQQLGVHSSTIFSRLDYSILRAAVKNLPGLLALIVEMRFWHNRSLSEISMDLGVSDRTVEEAIDTACRRLREECLRHPGFSRSKFNELKNLRSQSVA